MNKNLLYQYLIDKKVLSDIVMMQQSQTTRVLTVQEVAELLRVHRSTVSRFAKSGKLRSYLVGNRRLFKDSDVWAFFENQVAGEYVFGKET